MAGLALSTTTVTNSYAAVQFMGSGITVYPISYNGTVVNSFWDVEISGITESEVGKGFFESEVEKVSFSKVMLSELFESEVGKVSFLKVRSGM